LERKGRRGGRKDKKEGKEEKITEWQAQSTFLLSTNEVGREEKNRQRIRRRSFFSSSSILLQTLFSRIIDPHHWHLTTIKLTNEPLKLTKSTIFDHLNISINSCQLIKHLGPSPVLIKSTE